MGWAEPRGPGKYRARWRDQSGRAHTRSGFTSKAAARKYADVQEDLLQRGQLATPGRSTPTWGVWQERWQLARKVEPSTARGDSHRVRNHLLPRWGDVQLSRITTEDVQVWVNQLDARTGRDELAGTTVQRIYHLLAASLTAAVDAGVIAVNPCNRRVSLPAAGEGHETFLTRDEADAVLHQLEDVEGGLHRRTALFLLGTGERFGEAAGHHWARVDLAERRAADIVETYSSATGRVKLYTKGRSRRDVPLPSWLATELDAMDAGRGSKATSCGLTHPKGSARCRSALVLTRADGSPIDNYSFGHYLRAAALRAGVGHVRPHDLRHTYASWLVQNGRPMNEVARLLGHSSVTTTERYAHLARTSHDDARRALE